jgi:hypothetical protein
MALRNATNRAALPALALLALIAVGLGAYFYMNRRRAESYDYEDDDEKKRKYTRYYCYDKSSMDHWGTVDTWWAGNCGAEWACNEWIDDCKNNNRSCIARKRESQKGSASMKGSRRFRDRKARYNCFVNDNKVGEVDTWWGGKDDALWACNEWLPECNRGCTKASAA